jgi:hypothetical protein
MHPSVCELIQQKAQPLIEERFLFDVIKGRLATSEVVSFIFRVVVVILGSLAITAIISVINIRFIGFLG